MAGFGITPGEAFIPRILRELQASNLVVFMLSPNYYASAFCGAELGGAWALDKEVFPLIFPGTPPDPGSVLTKTQSSPLNAEGLDAFHTRLLRDRLITPDTGRWNECRKAFLGKLPRLLKQGGPLKMGLGDDSETIKRLTAEREAAEARANALEARLASEQLLQQRARTGPLHTEFIPLVKKARSALRELGPLLTRVVFATLSGEPWHGNHDVAWDLHIQVKYGTAVIRNENTHPARYEANNTDPEVKDAMDALGEVDDVLSDVPPDDVVQYLTGC